LKIAFIDYCLLKMPEMRLMYHRQIHLVNSFLPSHDGARSPMLSLRKFHFDLRITARDRLCSVFESFTLSFALRREIAYAQSSKVSLCPSHYGERSPMLSLRKFHFLLSSLDSGNEIRLNIDLRRERTRLP